MFEKYDSFPCRVAVYVPGTNNVNQACNNQAEVKLISKWFSKAFGGATSYNATGSWISETAGLITEDVTIIYSFTDEKTLAEKEAFLEKTCLWLKKRMHQEAISLEINNRLYFI